MRTTRRQTEAVRAYVEREAHEPVVHLEKAASELVGPVRHDIWDVHCTDSRWWVITEPTNLYSQDKFPSRDEALSFHIGLALRMSYEYDRRIPAEIPAATYCAVPGGVGSRPLSRTRAATRPRTSKPSAYACASA